MPKRRQTVILTFDILPRYVRDGVAKVGCSSLTAAAASETLVPVEQVTSTCPCDVHVHSVAMTTSGCRHVTGDESEVTDDVTDSSDDDVDDDISAASKHIASTSVVIAW